MKKLLLSAAVAGMLTNSVSAFSVKETATNLWNKVNNRNGLIAAGVIGVSAVVYLVHKNNLCSKLKARCVRSAESAQ